MCCTNYKEFQREVKLWKGKSAFMQTQWRCKHVLEHFPDENPWRESDPEGGEGYDDAWPPSLDPCWEWLAQPTAEYFRETRSNEEYQEWVEGSDYPVEMLENSYWWLVTNELLAVSGVDGNSILTLKGSRWLNRKQDLEKLQRLQSVKRK